MWQDFSDLGLAQSGSVNMNSNSWTYWRAKATIRMLRVWKLEWIRTDILRKMSADIDKIWKSELMRWLPTAIYYGFFRSKNLIYYSEKKCEFQCSQQVNSLLWKVLCARIPNNGSRKRGMHLHYLSLRLIIPITFKRLNKVNKAAYLPRNFSKKNRTHARSSFSWF